METDFGDAHVICTPLSLPPLPASTAELQESAFFVVSGVFHRASSQCPATADLQLLDELSEINGYIELKFNCVINVVTPLVIEVCMFFTDVPMPLTEFLACLLKEEKPF